MVLCAGGLLLSVLATSSTILDHYLRRVNEGFSIGFTSILIIVSSISSAFCCQALGNIVLHLLHNLWTVIVANTSCPQEQHFVNSHTRASCFLFFSWSFMKTRRHCQFSSWHTWILFLLVSPGGFNNWIAKILSSLQCNA